MLIFWYLVGYWFGFVWVLVCFVLGCFGFCLGLFWVLFWVYFGFCFGFILGLGGFGFGVGGSVKTDPYGWMCCL